MHYNILYTRVLVQRLSLAWPDPSLGTVLIVGLYKRLAQREAGCFLLFLYYELLMVVWCDDFFVSTRHIKVGTGCSLNCKACSNDHLGETKLVGCLLL